MSRSGMILMFLIASLFVMLAYGAFNMFVTNHVEEVISQAPELPDGVGQSTVSARCESAEARYDALINDVPDDGNFDLRDRQIETVLAEIERSCG